MLMPAAASLAADCLPIGFAHGARLLRAVMAGQAVTMADLEAKPAGAAWELRQESVALGA
jgi:predicted homoserine dehydrogenase-like protein